MAHWHTRIIVISLSAGLTSLTVSHSWWCRRLRSPPPRAPPWPSPATSTRLHSSWPPPSQPTFWLLALWWIFLGAQILTLKLATNNLLYEKRWNPARLYNCQTSNWKLVKSKIINDLELIEFPAPVASPLQTTDLPGSISQSLLVTGTVMGSAISDPLNGHFNFAVSIIKLCWLVVNLVSGVPRDPS